MSIQIKFEDIHTKANSFMVEHPHHECVPLVGEIIEHRLVEGTKRFRTRDVTFIYNSHNVFEGLLYTVIEAPTREDVQAYKEKTKDSLP